jgi:PilZ domain-containing protein
MKKCVVVALDEKTRDFLAVSLKALQMEAVSLASLGELRATLRTVSVCGILLELATAIKAVEQDKKDTSELFELYPFAKFKLVDNEVRMLGHTLPGFVDKCRQFQPRSIRTDIREARYLAVYLSSDATFKDPEKVVTANISRSGCFLYSAREWVFGSRVWLKFLGDEAVVCGTVCSSRPWGNNRVLPSIGIRLDTSIAGSV